MIEIQDHSDFYNFDSDFHYTSFWFLLKHVFSTNEIELKIIAINVLKITMPEHN